MKLVADDFRKLQPALLALLAMVILGAGALLFSRSELDRAQNGLNEARRQRNEIDGRLRQVRGEENEIRQKAAVFDGLQSRRILGEEQRLEWVELLEKIRARHRLPEMYYEIAPRHALDKTPGGQLALYASAMKLDLKLLHEEDLTRLLDDLRHEAPALIQVKRCEISRLPRTTTDGAPAASLQAACLIDWITLSTVEKAKESTK